MSRLKPRSGLVLALVLSGSPFVGVVEAQSDPDAERREVTVRGVHGARSIQHSVEWDRSATDTKTGTSPASWRRHRVPGAVYYATFPTMEVQPDGSRCVRNRRRAYSDPVAAAAAEDAQNALWRLLAASFPLCPRTTVPATTPAAQAAEFWRVVGEDLLPHPTPRIQPGFMLAGKLAYLEAGTVPTARFEHPTPAGMLTIEASAQHVVDWGDGSPVDGPFDHAGGPWPEGTITHYWTEIGHYDVRVIQRWSGRWLLGAESGELADLQTEGVIEDFRIEEVQAVINR